MNSYAGLNEDFLLLPLLATPLNERKVLLVAEHGGWVILNKNEASRILRMKNALCDPSVYKELETSGILLTPKNKDMVLSKYRERFFPNRDRMLLYFELGERFDPIQIQKQLHQFLNSMRFPVSHFSVVFVIRFTVKPSLLKDLIETFYEDSSIDSVSLYFKNPHVVRTDGILELLEKKGVAIRAEFSIEDILSTTPPPYIKDWADIFGEKNTSQLCEQTIRITPEFLNQDPREFVNRCLEFGITRASCEFSIFTESVTDETADKFINDMFDFWSGMISYVLHNTQSFVEINLYSILSRIMGVRNQFGELCSFMCFGGINILGLTEKGKIFPCRKALNIETFNLACPNAGCTNSEISVEDLSAFLKLSVFNPLCQACIWRPFCSPCPVNTYLSFGSCVSPFKPDLFCKLKERQFRYIFNNISQNRDVFLKYLSRW